MSETLDRVAPGTTVRLGEADATLADTLREQLAAYGLLPGHRVTVVAQQPMTVVLCDHVELALEATIKGTKYYKDKDLN